MVGSIRSWQVRESGPGSNLHGLIFFSEVTLCSAPSSSHPSRPSLPLHFAFLLLVSLSNQKPNKMSFPPEDAQALAGPGFVQVPDAVNA